MRREFLSVLHAHNGRKEPSHPPRWADWFKPGPNAGNGYSNSRPLLKSF